MPRHEPIAYTTSESIIAPSSCLNLAKFDKKGLFRNAFLAFSGTQTLAGIRVQNYEFYLNWREKNDISQQMNRYSGLFSPCRRFPVYGLSSCVHNFIIIVFKCHFFIRRCTLFFVFFGRTISERPPQIQSASTTPSANVSFPFVHLPFCHCSALF